ncbi:MBL fold metallo-hydrolase [Ravibacter arvi]|uniref:MBL fold metallo-hydrolase n=2 Tax=Ravibacter arvi TaxID=2051041 RepID=A0ABP8M0F7_9BACT
MYLLEIDDFRILIDCGLDFDLDEKGRKLLYEEQKSVFPFEPSMVNIVLLTHAHIDHSGQIPNLYKEGFEGRVVCTEPTAALTELLLYDVARVNRRRVENQQTGAAGKKRRRKRKEFPKDLYLEKDVAEAVNNFVPVAFGKSYRLSDHVQATYYPAGHLLGAAHIFLEIFEGGKRKTICFSGDLGRKNYPLLVDPAPVPAADYLICETTYGNRRHEDTTTPEDALMAVIRRTCVERPGRLIIPAFSVGRTQALLHVLNRLYVRHKLPPIKVFSDSPLAHASTRVYQKYYRMLNREARDFQEDENTLFDFENLNYIASTADSHNLNNYKEPSIIISASGMIQGGRVEHHVAANIQNPYATILLVGYASEGTLGWRLLNGQEHVNLKGEAVKVLANVEKIDVFSGHGDLSDLENFVKQQDPKQLKTVFLVHGEAESMLFFKSVLNGHDFPNVEMPERGASYEL